MARIMMTATMTMTMTMALRTADGREGDDQHGGG